MKRVLHFDAPLSIDELEAQAARSIGEVAHQGSLVYLNTVRRVLRIADTPNFFRRTFLYRTKERTQRAFGQELPPRDAYLDFLRSNLAEAGIDRAIVWACPVIFDYQAIVDTLRPLGTIADVIDDQRTFPGTSDAYRARISDAYETILADADMVLANCEAVRQAFSSLRPDIKVVPNGAELFPDLRNWPDSPDLADLRRPIIGYVGNLRDRIDFDLLETVAQRFPKATIALVGSAHGRPAVLELAKRCANIRLIGVRPYEEALRLMRGFDVAIMPHLKNEQSDRMNPLKLYVYFAVGVPVVTSAVSNIGDLAPYVSVAENAEQFVEAIASVLVGKNRPISASERGSILRRVSWESRVAAVWQHIAQG